MLTDEMQPLVEDAAKLLGFIGIVDWCGSTPVAAYADGHLCGFNPADPERGDLMKVADAAELDVNFQTECVLFYGALSANDLQHPFTKGDHDSKVLAILRAASAVLHSRGGV